MLLFFKILLIIILAIILFTIYYFKKNYKENNGTSLDIIKEPEFKHRKDINKLHEIPNFLTHKECDYIIKLAKPTLSRSGTIAGAKDEISDVRTSYNSWLENIDNDTYFDQIQSKIYNLVNDYTGFPKENCEPIQVVRYHKGQKYESHLDACHPEEDEACTEDIKRGGLRYATVIIYLNDGFEGGGTTFIKKNITIKPEKGKAAIFYNLNADNKYPNLMSEHSGDELISGVKWMCNVWVRLNEFV